MRTQDFQESLYKQAHLVLGLSHSECVLLMRVFEGSNEITVIMNKPVGYTVLKTRVSGRCQTSAEAMWSTNPWNDDNKPDR